MSIWRRARATALQCGIATALATAAAANVHAQAVDGANAEDPFKIFIADRFSYEDNLFRVNDALLTGDPAAVNIQSFDDYVNRLSAGVDVRVDASRQVFALNLRFDDWTYQENDYLDHRGGAGTLRWDFDIGTHLSGKVDALYNRAQAGFSNYVLFVKDIVETQSYLGELRFKIGSRWALLGGASIGESTHSAIERRTSNMEFESGTAGIEYQTPSNHLLAADYTVMDATFPVAERIYAADIGYRQTVPALRMRYVISEKTRLTARVGYLKRDYTNPTSGDYSGNIWKIAAYWEPRAQLYFDLEAYHELKAYADSEADYFVANGIRLVPTWAPTVQMKFELGLVYEDQSYRAAATPVSVITDPGREDKVRSAGLTWNYTPRDFLSLSLSYRLSDRESNRIVRTNEAEVASAQFRIAF